MTYRSKISLTLLSTVASVAIAASCWAQSADAGGDQSVEGGQRTLDAVVVTAQKRAQDLQDVPVSVVATTGATIEKKNIQQLGELADFIPNFSVTKHAIGDLINIRGIQSGANAGLEQSVSTFVDGVYRGRGVQSRFAFLDVERVEVLRGPQGTLFGKNTIGGAVNITAAKPTDQFEAALATTYTFENVEEYEVTGYVSLPVSDNVRARIAGKYYDQDEGYITNTLYDESVPTLEEYVVRGTLEMDVTDSLLVTMRAEYGDFDQIGRPLTTYIAGPLAILGIEDMRTDVTSMGSLNNDVLNFGSNGNFSGDNFEASLTGALDLGRGDLTVIGAYSAYEFLRESDADFSPLDFFRFDDSEDFEQFSLEARYASEAGNAVDYLIGAYYQNNELFADGRGDFNLRGVPGAPGELAIDTFLLLGCNAAIAAGANPATERSCLISGLISAFDGTPLAYDDFSRLHALDQDSELFAIFGEATWNMTDALALTVGLRYADENKKAVQSAVATDFGTRNINTLFGNTAAYAAIGAPDPFFALGEAQVHSNNLERSEGGFTWSTNLNWRPTEDLLVYGKVSTGFKAGGFNSFAFSADPDEAEYEEETVIGGEIGAKMTLLDGAAELNGAIFYSEFSDLQTALFTGSTSFIVQNAAGARNQGLELDGRWAVTDRLTLGGSLAYLDFEFTSFPNAGCTVDQLLQFRTDASNPLATLRDCAAAEINDLRGRPSENSPELSGSFSLNHALPLFGDYELNTLIDLNYQGGQFRQGDLDPVSYQDEFSKLNVALIFGKPDGGWDVALIAKNLTDETTFSYSDDTPSLDTARQVLIDRPRTVGVRLRIRSR